ncbi:MAG: hypothetical protein ABI556_03475 [Gemmatimonadales bacterium]
MFTIDPALGWKLSPGKVVRHRTRYFDMRYSINSMGFRDSLRKTANPLDKERVLLLGDSQIFGWGVPAGDRISNLIEAQHPSLEMWNMAVPGYGLDQEIISYDRNGGSLGATGLILFVSTNIISRTRSDFIFNKPKPKFTLDSAGGLVLASPKANVSAFTDVVYRLLSPFYLPYFVDTQLKRIRDGRRPQREGREATTPVGPEGIRLTEALLLRAKSLADGRNHSLLVLAELPPPSMKTLKEFADRNGIAIVPTPWTSAPPPLVFGTYDGHWNARGDAVVAGQLALAMYSRK